MPAAVVFPGQGTQAPAMASAWCDHPAWCVVDRAEAALGEDLAHLVLDADTAELGRTRSAQLAVLATSLVAWEALRPLVTEPVAFAGHSLGQVTALIAAGTIGLEDGVRFAARRAELTQSAADARPGRMAALLGATPEQAEAACDHETSWVANVNGVGQVVIAGTADGIDAAVERAKAGGVRRARPLDVGGAFHTPLMSGAQAGLADAIQAVELHAPAAPVVSNEDGVAYDDADGWRARLVSHPTRPVLWAACMQTLTDLGADSFVEAGHGAMIAGLAKRTVPQIAVIGIGGPSDIHQLEVTA